jgi:hypothetical protein
MLGTARSCEDQKTEGFTYSAISTEAAARSRTATHGSSTPLTSTSSTGRRSRLALCVPLIYRIAAPEMQPMWFSVN